MLEFLHEIRKAIVPVEDVWVAIQIELGALLHQVLGQDIIGHQSELELRAILLPGPEHLAEWRESSHSRQDLQRGLGRRGPWLSPCYPQGLPSLLWPSDTVDKVPFSHFPCHPSLSVVI